MDKTTSMTSANVANMIISRPSPDHSLHGIYTVVTPSLAQSGGYRTSLEVFPKVDSKGSPYRAGAFFDQSTTTGFDDTIHYLSPASPISPRTVHEGEVIYETPSFMRFLQEFGRVQEYSSISSSTISCIEPELQRTIAIVKPEAMQYKDVILRVVIQAGFAIINTRTIHLTPEQVSEIYTKHYGSPAFPHMVVSMSVGPVLTISLAGINAVTKWKNLVGKDRSLHAEWFYPMSMRVRFGLHPTMPQAIHASDTYPEANRENRYFYSESILEPLLMEEDKVWDFCGLYVNPTLLNGLTEVVRVKPVDPILFLAEWLLLNNPYQPRFAPDISVLPT